MMDEADRAEDLIERRLAHSLSQRKEIGPAACGFCHACGERIQGGLRFCDHECRDLWQELHSRGKA